MNNYNYRREGIWPTKSLKVLLGCLLLLGLSLTFSCKKDSAVTVPSDAKPPSADLNAVPLQKTAGYYEVKLFGKIEDQNGLKSIRLFCDSFYLDQTIKLPLDSMVTRYDLDRTVKAPLSRQNESSTVKVTITNIYDQQTVVELSVNDIEAPSFDSEIKDFIVEIKDHKAELNLNFSVRDNKRLKALVVKIPDLDIIDSTSIEGKAFNYKKKMDLPQKKGSFPVSFYLYDHSGLMTQQSAIIRISKDVPYSGDLDLLVAPRKSKGDFSRYLSGMPGKVERTGDFLYKVRYYSPGPATEIFLLGQPSFKGYLFGQDPNGEPGDLTYEDQQSKPIILPEKGYYVITVDTKTEKYRLEKDTPAASEAWSLPSNPLAMAGAYFDDYPGASRPKAAVVCVPEPGNPFRYITRVRMHKLVSFTLTPKDLQNDKWLSPFWRYDATLGGPLIQGGSGKNNSFPLSDPAQPYWIVITFDLHLQTCVVENDGPAN